MKKRDQAEKAGAGAGGALRRGKEIRAERVRIVGDAGHEVVSLARALRAAEERGLDLVEVNPKADPPVCKYLDYNKVKYDTQKKQKEVKLRNAAQSAKNETKEVRMRTKIGQGDFDTKLNRARGFLEKGMQVRIKSFNGTQEECVALLERVGAALAGEVTVVREPRFDKGWGTMVVVPRKEKGAA